MIELLDADTLARTTTTTIPFLQQERYDFIIHYSKQLPSHPSVLINFHVRRFSLNTGLIPMPISCRNLPTYVPTYPMWEQHGVEILFNACGDLTSNPAAVIPKSLQSNPPSIKTTNNQSRYNDMYQMIQNMVLPMAVAKHCFRGAAPTGLSIVKKCHHVSLCQLIRMYVEFPSLSLT
jgi:hypothetical protein